MLLPLQAIAGDTERSVRLNSTYPDGLVPWGGTFLISFADNPQQPNCGPSEYFELNKSTSEMYIDGEIIAGFGPGIGPEYTEAAGQHTAVLVRRLEYDIYKGQSEYVRSESIAEKGSFIFTPVKVGAINGPASPLFDSPRPYFAFPVGTAPLAFTAVPSPAGAWPDGQPVWNDGRTGSTCTLSAASPFFRTLTVSCGSSSLSADVCAIAVSSLEATLAGNPLKQVLLKGGAKAVVLDIHNAGAALTVTATASPDLNALASMCMNPEDLADSHKPEDFLPKAWSFTGGSPVGKGLLSRSIAISQDTDERFCAKCGSSSATLDVLACGIRILDAAGQECASFILAVPGEDDSAEEKAARLLPVTFSPVGLAALHGRLPSGGDRLAVSFGDGIVLWKDKDRSARWQTGDSLPLDSDTVAYAEAAGGTGTSSLTLSYNSSAFSATRKCTFSMLDLRPKTDCPFLLLNDDNDDADRRNGGRPAAVVCRVLTPSCQA